MPDQDGTVLRIYRKALANELVIAVGSGLGPESKSIRSLIDAVRDHFVLPEPDESAHRWPCKTWNRIIDAAQEQGDWQAVSQLLSQSLGSPTVTDAHMVLARVPISNFIDATLDRALLNAIRKQGRNPKLHDWTGSRMIGAWRQLPPETPSVFMAMQDVRDPEAPFSAFEPNTWHQQDKIHLENMGEMLRGRDLLMLGFSDDEAEHLLHLHRLCLHFDKGFVECEAQEHATYWAWRGVTISPTRRDQIISKLAPSFRGSRYGPLDGLIPGMMLIDIARQCRYDTFISYFSGDKAMASRIHGDLALRGLNVWRDDTEIEVGESIPQSLDKGLEQSYTMVIVLSPDALQRPWVRSELDAGITRRNDGRMRILPALYKDCDIPPLLAGYKYADFREERRYDEQIGLLDRAIRNAVRELREKK
jgi:hypothetical protein